LWSDSQKVYNPERYDEMAERIRELHAKNPDFKLMVPAGLKHLLPLRVRLDDLDSTVLTLSQYDEL